MSIEELNVEEMSDCPAKKDEREFSLSSAWMEWLEDNEYEYPQLVQELEADIPRLLPVLVPMLGSDSAKTSLWSFYMNCVMTFLCALPCYRVSGVSLRPSEGKLVKEEDITDDDFRAVTIDEISAMDSRLISAVLSRRTLIDNSSWWDCCAIIEQFDPWPRDAVEWTVWLVKVGRFVQDDNNAQRFRQCLEMMRADLADEELVPGTLRARNYMNFVIDLLFKYMKECAWC